MAENGHLKTLDMTDFPLACREDLAPFVLPPAIPGMYN
jgi:hypothetical protein